MKNLLLILVSSLFSIQSFAGSFPDGSEPIKSISADGTYFVFNCGAIKKNFEVDKNSSHALQFRDVHVDVDTLRQNNGLNKGYPAAIAYIDIDGDGDTDIFMSGTNNNSEPDPEVYLNDGYNNFKLKPEFFADFVVPTSPRKSIIGDYNGDNKEDIYIAGHGFDEPPFPGEAPVLILSNSKGYSSIALEEFVGFQHGAASADIDADGDLDIVVSDIKSNGGVSLLLNDGLGNFTLARNKLREFNGRGGYFTVELVDVDEDGYVDLLLSGHEMDGANSTIFWGSGLGDYSYWNNKTDLPKVPGMGSVIDIDVGDIDNDGDKDIILNRTGSSDGDFYIGYYVQILKNNGARSFIQSGSIVNKNNPGCMCPRIDEGWFYWLRLVDKNFDGSLDIVVDDAWRNLIWINSGSGSYSSLY